MLIDKQTATTQILSFANGNFSVDVKHPEFVVCAKNDLADGDWKTAIVKGWKYLFKDEQMVVDKIFINCEGQFVSGLNPRGERVDLLPANLIFELE